MTKAADAFRTISEVADDLDVPKHVLRFWELKFPQIKPMKRGGGRRYYRPEDVELLRGIHALLHGEGYTIRGVQKILRSHGVEHVKSRATPAPAGSATPAAGLPAVPPGARTAPTDHKRSRRPPAAVPPPVRPVSEGGWRAGVAAVIRELEACRAILLGTAQQPAAGQPAKRASSRR